MLPTAWEGTGRAQCWRERVLEGGECKQKTELLCSICSAFSFSLASFLSTVLFEAFPILCVCVCVCALGEKRLKLCCHFFISSISHNILCNNVALQRAQKNEMNCEKCARLGWVGCGLLAVTVCADWWVSGAAFELNYIRAAAAAAPAAVWQFVIFSKWQLTLPAVLDQQAS